MKIRKIGTGKGAVDTMGLAGGSPAPGKGQRSLSGVNLSTRVHSPCRTDEGREVF